MARESSSYVFRASFFRSAEILLPPHPEPKNPCALLC